MNLPITKVDKQTKCIKITNFSLLKAVAKAYKSACKGL